MGIRSSFIEGRARERASAILDPGTFRELLDPFERMESPHLARLGIVPQSDDGVVIARGTIDGLSAVVIAIEGKFQGGGIGEVSGAKIAGALEQALSDNREGFATRAVLVLETGGVRLQEGNYGLLAIAEIQAAIVALRQYVPVVCVIAGMIGCFGGMSITAGLCSKIIMTRQARLGLNGPEVIEQEAGILEFDSRNRPMVWSITGGEQRVETGLSDVLEEDEAERIRHAVIASLRQGLPAKHRSSQVARFLARLGAIDPQERINAKELRRLWSRDIDSEVLNGATPVQLEDGQAPAKPAVTSRGRIWFDALKGEAPRQTGEFPSVLCADVHYEGQVIRFLAVVPDPDNRFPRATRGEVGLNEGWTLARYVNEAVEADRDGSRRAIVAIVDVPSQAYGYREEMLGLFQACAAAVDAYATARLAGHPVVALLVGNAISGAFLAHGLQANRMLALDDPDVAVQVMSKASAARVTRCSVEELEHNARHMAAAAHDIRSFAKLGALHELIEGINPDAPSAAEIACVRSRLFEAVESARGSATDLSHRLASEEAASSRSASIAVRERMRRQWK
ncbi:biotin-independent malonate decarboxylase subunit beta [Paenibacillus hemerocallicola]|uniref:Biotin-independent malonate decarboxylase subunit beta n=1 Tax=Paenibacillus hemerocallicola TaxID=1172614 RepID=A0A5C4TC22_9BACL|nr:biotin-independent malonate decarboxylase subunit beta [Paenibacillus hemerocallicola]